MKPETLPFVTVIIPTRNEEERIGACLDSVVEATYPKTKLEILVVDGMSEDRTRAIVSEISERTGRVRLLENAARTVPHAMNIGIHAARGEVIVRMDAHAKYGPDYVHKLVAWMEQLGADNVGGTWVTRPGTTSMQAQAIALILSHPFGIGNARYRLGTLEEPIEVDTVPFGCYRRDVFKRVGLYDELFIRNQDDELNGRLKMAGGRIFLVPGVQCEYYSRSSLRQLASMLYQYGYFKPLVVIKLGQPTTFRQLIPPAFTVVLLGMPCLFWLMPSVLLVWGTGAIMHTLANLYASGSLVARRTWRLFPYLFVGFLLCHLSYGLGYLKGIFDFGILRRHRNRTFREMPLSR